MEVNFEDVSRGLADRIGGTLLELEQWKNLAEGLARRVKTLEDEAAARVAPEEVQEPSE